MPASHVPSDNDVIDMPEQILELPAEFDTIIVGAGIAGLTVAHHLSRQKKRVLVLEAANHVGGAIRSFRDGGFIVECGPNTVLDTRPEVSTLIDEAGLAGDRITASGTAKKRFIVRNGKPMALPMSPPALLKTDLFSTRAKIRLAAEPLVRRAKPGVEETVASFVERRLGREFLDYAIDPFVSGVYAGKPEGLSVQHAFPKLVEIEQRYGSLILGQIRGAKERKKRSDTAKTEAGMFSFRDGLDQLPITLANNLGSAVQTGCRVSGLARIGGSWHVDYTDSTGHSKSAHSETIVYASGIHNTSLLDPLGLESASLKEVYHPPLSVVALGFKRENVDHPLDGFGMLVPSVEKRNILGALFSSTLFEGRAPAGHVLITAFVGGSRQPELTKGDDETLIQTVMGDLRELLGVRADPVFQHITRWSAAIPQYNIGYGEVKDALTALEARNAGLFFTGNYITGISVPDTIHLSNEIAGRVDAYLAEELSISR